VTVIVFLYFYSHLQVYKIARTDLSHPWEILWYMYSSSFIFPPCKTQQRQELPLV
jgi:hypothetical protein